MARARSDAPQRGDAAFADELALKLRATEEALRGEARALARSVQAVVGGVPLTEIGDKVATPLQEARP
jgi:hypothetical protein